MPDIGKLLWPRSVAVVGASSDTERLRGRILQVMKGHPFAGPIYPVCRSEAEVQGLTAFRSVADAAGPAGSRGAHHPGEIRSGGARALRRRRHPGRDHPELGLRRGARAARPRACRTKIRAIAERYDMAVSGPNGEGFANTAAALCPTFSPVMEAGATPPAPLDGVARGQVAVISQSGGMGFAFFDRGRPKNLSFRYIVTTGNEACLETFDFVDYMLDEGKTDVFLLLLEDVKNLATFERVAAKALRAGKPLIVSKLGQSQAGSRAVPRTPPRAPAPTTTIAPCSRATG